MKNHLNVGKFLIIKISGELLNYNNFKILIDILNKKKLPIILVCGGGKQITDEYKKNTGIVRKKGKNGGNFTSNDLINNGVIPAYLLFKINVSKIKKWKLNIFTYKDIICDQVTELGKVGVVRKFNKNFSTNKINVIPFLGIGKGGDYLNINADDIVLKISEKFYYNIIDIIFVTGVGGVLDNKGNIIPIITKKDIKSILKGNSNIKIEGGMLKKIEIIYTLLQKGIYKIGILNFKDFENKLKGCNHGTIIVK